MSCRTWSNSKPRVSIVPAARAQNMNASSGSGLWPRRMRMRRATYLRPPSRRLVRPSEEPALERAEQLLAQERLRVDRATVSLEHAHVVLEHVVRMLERVVELVALEDVLVGTGLVG